MTEPTKKPVSQWHIMGSLIAIFVIAGIIGLAVEHFCSRTERRARDGKDWVTVKPEIMGRTVEVPSNRVLLYEGKINLAYKADGKRYETNYYVPMFDGSYERARRDVDAVDINALRVRYNSKNPAESEAYLLEE